MSDDNFHGYTDEECMKIENEAMYSEIKRLRAENERLRAACDRMMIGGNHIADYRTERWPDPGSRHLTAFETLGAGSEYDMWCCWNAIMEARATLEPKP